MISDDFLYKFFAKIKLSFVGKRKAEHYVQLD